jgi:hypothetical protein
MGWWGVENDKNYLTSFIDEPFSKWYLKFYFRKRQTKSLELSNFIHNSLRITIKKTGGNTILLSKSNVALRKKRPLKKRYLFLWNLTLPLKCRWEVLMLLSCCCCCCCSQDLYTRQNTLKTQSQNCYKKIYIFFNHCCIILIKLILIFKVKKNHQFVFFSILKKVFFS